MAPVLWSPRLRLVGLSFELVQRTVFCGFEINCGSCKCTKMAGKSVEMPREMRVPVPDLRIWRKVLMECGFSAAMERACPRCTFLNKGGCVECQVCAQAFVCEWNCSACTFINGSMEVSCEICGLERDTSGDVSAPIRSFRPLTSQRDDQFAVADTQAKGGKLELGQSSKAGVSGDRGGSERSSAGHVSQTFQLDGRSETGSDVSGKNAGDCNDTNASKPPLKILQESMKGICTAGPSGKLDGDECNGGNIESVNDLKCAPVVIMFYNVWFREDLEVVSRMAAIGKMIDEHQPHVICLQEVTPNIYHLLQKSSWWKNYECSVSPHLASTRAYFIVQLVKLPVKSFQCHPFSNSIMGRELGVADVEVGTGKRLVIATSHLESPCPGPPKWDQMFSKERVHQATEALKILKDVPNVVFGGDMNWDDPLDGAPPLPSGWCDVWLQLRPKEPGLTFDSKANAMLTGSRLRKRLDRVFCHFQDFMPESIEMIGLQPIPGLFFRKEKKVKQKVQMLSLPVLPSDHFGLLVKIRQNHE